MNPYISFVVAARNDDYGGNFLHRLQVFVNALLALWEKHDLDAELIIVEWNPPGDRPRLREVLTWPKELKTGTVRFIEVPWFIHYRLPNSDRMPIFEYIAKNVGIRRAKGEYVLATNPDLLFSNELIQFLASRQLSPKCFYRVDRYDVDPAVPLEMPVKQQLQFCATHSFRVQTAKGIVPLSKGWANHTLRKASVKHTLKNAIKPLVPIRTRRLISKLRSKLRDDFTHHEHEPLHIQAPGDFFLMAKSNWHALKGYPELKSHSFIDGYICFMAASSGLQQQILKSPLRIYHQEHNRSEHLERPLTDRQEFFDSGRRMLESQQPEILNDDDWGHGREQLPECWVEGVHEGRVHITIDLPMWVYRPLRQIKRTIYPPALPVEEPVEEVEEPIQEKELIPNIVGDRAVEWSWVISQMPPGPGEALDLGPEGSYLSLIAAQRGFNVIALDLQPIHWPYLHPRLWLVQGDILKPSLIKEHFDLVINCSTVEHVGLAGRYGVAEARPDGDLEAMVRLRELMKPGGAMLLTIPVGQDEVFAPFCRVFGTRRLPRLFEGYTVEKEAFWVKDSRNRWVLSDRETALNFKASAYSDDPRRCVYALGCFVLRKAED